MFAGTYTVVTNKPIKRQLTVQNKLVFDNKWLIIAMLQPEVAGVPSALLTEDSIKPGQSMRGQFVLTGASHHGLSLLFWHVVWVLFFLRHPLTELNCERNMFSTLCVLNLLKG